MVGREQQACPRGRDQAFTVSAPAGPGPGLAQSASPVFKGGPEARWETGPGEVRAEAGVPSLGTFAAGW